MRAPRRSARSLVCSRGRSGHSREAPGKPQTERGRGRRQNGAEDGQGASDACSQEATNRTTVCPLGALPGCGLRSAGDTPSRHTRHRLDRRGHTYGGSTPAGGPGDGPLGTWLPPGEQRRRDKNPGPTETEFSTRSGRVWRPQNEAKFSYHETRKATVSSHRSSS